MGEALKGELLHRPLYDLIFNCSGQCLKNSLEKGRGRDLPGSPVIRSLSFHAGDMGLISGQGTKTPHATHSMARPLFIRDKPTTTLWLSAKSNPK